MAEIRILLVDDHDAMRAALRAFLARQPGLQVVGEARSGREALERAAELLPDVVVMDVRMPDIDGADATRELRARHPEVRVVAVSAYAADEVVSRLRAAGASAVVAKDAAFEQLVPAIRAAAAARAAHSLTTR
jgi:DNA-binding NarL/FixJ family response regulator